jgi:iron complex transport system substrate-binding protein
MEVLMSGKNHTTRRPDGKRRFIAAFGGPIDWPASGCTLVFLLFSLSVLQPFSPCGLAAPPPIRVISQTVGNDELLLAVAAPSQIAALSHLAADPDFSAVAAQAAAFPRLSKNATAESLLAHSPTLILFTDYSRPELVAQTRRAGVRAIIIKNYRTLADAYANLRLVAAELGPDAAARAARLIAGCETRLAALRARMAGARPVRVIAPSTYGMIPGRDSTFQDLCDHAAAENLAATHGGLRGHAPPPAEKMLTWPVDKVVLITASHPHDVRPAAGEDPVQAALAPFLKLPPYQFMPAIRDRRVALLEPWQLSCVSHHRLAAYERLARELHPERFPHAE